MSDFPAKIQYSIETISFSDNQSLIRQNYDLRVIFGCILYKADTHFGPNDVRFRQIPLY